MTDGPPTGRGAHRRGFDARLPARLPAWPTWATTVPRRRGSLGGSCRSVPPSRSARSRSSSACSASRSPARRPDRRGRPGRRRRRRRPDPGRGPRAARAPHRAPCRAVPVAFTAGSELAAHREPARRARRLARGRLERAGAGRRARRRSAASAGSACASSAPTSRRRRGLRPRARLRARPDRAPRRPARPRRRDRLRGGTPVRRAARTGRALDRGGGRRHVVQALAVLERPLPVALPVKLYPPRGRDGRTFSRGGAGPHGASRRPFARARPTRWRLPRCRIATARPAARRRQRARGSRPGATRSSRRLARRPAGRGRGLRADAERRADRPGRPGPDVDVRRAAGDPARGALVERSRRPALVAPHAAEADDRGGAGARHRRQVAAVLDDLRRRREPHPQRPARRAPDRPPPRRPRRDFSFNETTGERYGVEGLSRGAGDHQRRAADRARRRRLPGLDDGLQRRLRGGPPDHGADEPRALHLALPARPRRDRQLSGPRPALRQRHRPLAAPADVRRLVVADGGALRHEPAPPVESETAPLVGHRAGARRRDDGPEPLVGETVVEEAGEPSRTTTSSGWSTTAGQLLYDDTWSSTTAASTGSSASGRSRADAGEAEAETKHDDDDDHDRRRRRPRLRRRPPRDDDAGDSTPP